MACHSPRPPSVSDFRGAVCGCRFRNLTGSDYSEAGVALARSLAAREAALGGVQLVVDDLLHTQLAAPFDLVLDKGTLDAVGLHPAHGPAHRRRYQDTMGRLLRPGGLLVSEPARLARNGAYCFRLCFSIKEQTLGRLAPLPSREMRKGA